MHSEVYPRVDPSNSEMSAKGNVVIVTGAGGGLGVASHLHLIPALFHPGLIEAHAFPKAIPRS